MQPRQPRVPGWKGCSSFFWNVQVGSTWQQGSAVLQTLHLRQFAREPMAGSGSAEGGSIVPFFLWPCRIPGDVPTAVPAPHTFHLVRGEVCLDAGFLALPLCQDGGWAQLGIDLLQPNSLFVRGLCLSLVRRNQARRITVVGTTCCPLRLPSASSLASISV